MREIPEHISHSQLTSYADCGERYRLERLVGVKGGSWWATILGSAVHEVTDWWDREVLGGAEPTLEWATALLREIFDQQTEISGERYGPPHASGRELKKIGWTGGPNKKDREWCLTYGPHMLKQYIDWRKETRWEIAIMPDGEPGIEYPINVEIVHPDTGEILPVVGQIDRIFKVPLRRRLRVVDLKTGKKPASKLQLVTYSAALTVQCPSITVGDAGYWVPGAEESEFELTSGIGQWSGERMWAMFLAARQGIEAGIFLPTVSSMCSGCLVRDYCWAVTGDKAEANIERRLNELG